MKHYLSFYVPIMVLPQYRYTRGYRGKESLVEKGGISLTFLCFWKLPSSIAQ